MSFWHSPHTEGDRDKCLRAAPAQPALRWGLLCAITRLWVDTGCCVSALRAMKTPLRPSLMDAAIFPVPFFLTPTDSASLSRAAHARSGVAHAHARSLLDWRIDNNTTQKHWIHITALAFSALHYRELIEIHVNHVNNLITSPPSHLSSIMTCFLDTFSILARFQSV